MTQSTPEAERRPDRPGEQAGRKGGGGGTGLRGEAGGGPARRTAGRAWRSCARWARRRCASTPAPPACWGWCGGPARPGGHARGADPGAGAGAHPPPCGSPSSWWMRWSPPSPPGAIRRRSPPWCARGAPVRPRRGAAPAGARLLHHPAASGGRGRAPPQRAGAGARQRP